MMSDLIFYWRNGDMEMPYMSRATFFLQECPTCGRQVQVRVEYLGRRIACRHCSAEFDATDDDALRSEPLDGDELLERAEKLLASSDADTRRWRPK